jgi:hypothetical protein
MVRELLEAATERCEVTTVPNAHRDGRRDAAHVRMGAVTHIGDWSGTLVGPWLEAAYARTLTGHDVDLWLPGAPPRPREETDPPELLIVSADGTLTSERPDQLGEIRFGTGLFGMQEAASTTFSVPRVALLSACHVGRGHTRADELHGASLPSMLLHRGVEAVVAPVSPVDDLSSAVFVTRTLYRLTSTDADAAMSLALAEVRG